MVNINHILSGQSARVQSPPGVSPLSIGSANQGAEKSSPQVVDRFTLGQAWKNKAGTPVNAGGCRCGSCPQCGAQAYSQQQSQVARAENPSKETTEPPMTAQEPIAATAEKSPTGDSLNPEELAQLQELQKIDQSVRAHEQAHMGAAGGLATSGVSLSYAKGPDGQNYAVGGEVSIDTSKAATPRETVAKMMKVRAAALAPSDPSAQDRKVAASASVAMGQARAELQLSQAGEGAQVIDQAIERIVGESGEESSDDVGGDVKGSYQRGQYQKVAANDGGELAFAL